MDIRLNPTKRELASMTEMNRALRLEDASLRDPERIDLLARRMGLVPPAPGQVIRMEVSEYQAASSGYGQRSSGS